MQFLKISGWIWQVGNNVSTRGCSCTLLWCSTTLTRYRDRWIGRLGLIELSARSPDFKPLIFFYGVIWNLIVEECRAVTLHSPLEWEDIQNMKYPIWQPRGIISISKRYSAKKYSIRTSKIFQFWRSNKIRTSNRCAMRTFKKYSRSGHLALPGTSYRCSKEMKLTFSGCPSCLMGIW